jgi:hypothetical protein
MTTTTIAMACVLVLGGCGKRERGEAPAQKPSAAASKIWKPLPKMAMQVELPDDMQVMDTSADAPGYSVSNNDCKADLNILPPAWPSTYEAEKADIEQDPGTKFKAFTKDTKTADGYHLEFDVESTMESGKQLYGYEIRRRVAGKDIICTNKLDSTAARDCAMAICLSAKPL